MKRFFTILALIPAIAFGAANDLKLTQRNAANTSFVERTVTPTAEGDVLTFNASLEPTKTATTAFGRSLWDDADASAARTTLGLVAVAASGSASDLTSGTVPDARFPATLPALSGVNLTALNAGNLASGTVPDARLSANVSLLGSSIDLSGAEATGTIATERLPVPVSTLAGLSGTSKLLWFDGTGTLAALATTDLDIQFQSGTDAERATVTYGVGVPAFATDTKRLWIGDGTTLGGVSEFALPAQSGQSGKFLTTDGTISSWAAVAASPLTATASEFTTPGNIFVNRTYEAPVSPAGNARGTGSVDLQMSRSAAEMVASGAYATIGGGAGNTASGYCSVVAGGASNSASGDYSVVGAGYSAAATGQFSVIGGGYKATASGQSSVVCGGGDIMAGIDRTNSANGNYSFVGGGVGNNATLDLSVVGGGDTNTASGYCSVVAGGASNSASGDYSFVVGGAGAKARLMGSLAHAGGTFAVQGDAQHALYVARTTTTNATPALLYLDGAAASNRLLLESGILIAATVNISGIKADGSQVAHYVRKVAIKNVASTTSLVGAVSSVGTDVEDDAAWDVAITADDTNDALAITVTGAAATTIRWVAVVDAVEIAYGN